jgi:EKC/KEOPS complex subunit CGI121/TPRKB
VFRLSPNNNIGESYKKFGISDTSSAIIAVKLPLSPSPSLNADAEDGGHGKDVGEAEGGYAKDEAITNESVSKHLDEVVQGTSVLVSETGEKLGSFCEVDKVRKVYKLDTGKKGKKGGVVNGDAGGEGERKEMESVILGVMALKGS